MDQCGTCSVSIVYSNNRENVWGPSSTSFDFLRSDHPRGREQPGRCINLVQPRNQLLDALLIPRVPVSELFLEEPFLFRGLFVQQKQQSEGDNDPGRVGGGDAKSQAAEEEAAVHRVAGVFVGSIRDELCVLAGLGEGAEGVAEVVGAPGNDPDAGEEGEKANGGDEVAEALGGEDDEEDEDGLDDEEGLAARACVGVGGGGVSASGWVSFVRGRRLLRAFEFIIKVGNTDRAPWCPRVPGGVGKCIWVREGLAISVHVYVPRPSRPCRSS